MPRPVLSLTAHHRDGLLLEVNVLPCESAGLPNSKSGVAGDPDGQKRRMLILFHIVRQALVPLAGDRGNGQPILSVLVAWPAEVTTGAYVALTIHIIVPY